MATPKLTKLELQIMGALWSRGRASIRELLETFPKKNRLAYTTVQTTIYRLEKKGAVRRVTKVGNSDIFVAAISRSAAQRRLIDDLLELWQTTCNGSPEQNWQPHAGKYSGIEEKVRELSSKDQPR